MEDKIDVRIISPRNSRTSQLNLTQEVLASSVGVIKTKNRKFKAEKADDHLNSQLKDLAKKTHFTNEQIQALSKIYTRITAAGKMDRLRFRDFVYSTFDITDDVVLDRMFNVFSEDSGTVSESQWIMRLSAMTRGNMDEKIAYVFQLYDITGDQTISREEVDHFLRNCVSTSYGIGGVDVDELTDAVKEIGDIIFKKLDVDRNGLITLEDFNEACTKDPLMLESLGHCLPSDKYIKSFLVLFADDYNHFDAGYSNKLGKSIQQDPVPLRPSSLRHSTKGPKKTGLSEGTKISLARYY